MDFLWDNQLYVDDNALSVNITRIREKLAGLGLTDFIKTKHRQVHHMSGKLFLKNHLPVILLNLLGALALSLFLLAVGNDIQTILFILAAWVLVLACTLPPAMSPRKKRLEKLLEMATQLEGAVSAPPRSCRCRTRRRSRCTISS